MAANCFHNKPTMSIVLLSLVCLNTVQVFGQSNYASHGNNINYIGNGLPEETVLDGKVSDIDLPIPAWAITVTSPKRLLMFARNDFSCQLSTVIKISR